MTIEREPHEWNAGECTECGYKCTHSGGKATCTKKATCDICGSEYGDIDPNNHGKLTHIDKVDATRDKEGNIEYWYCEECGKYFGDKDGTKEIQKADTITDKLKDTPSDDKKITQSQISRKTILTRARQTALQQKSRKTIQAKSRQTAPRLISLRASRKIHRPEAAVV